MGRISRTKIHYIIMVVVLLISIAFLVFSYNKNVAQTKEVREDIVYLEDMSHFKFEDNKDKRYTGKVILDSGSPPDLESYLTEEESSYIDMLEGQLGESNTVKVEGSAEDYIQHNNQQIECIEEETISATKCLEETVNYLSNSNTEFSEEYGKGINAVKEFYGTRFQLSNSLKEENEVFGKITILDEYDISYINKVISLEDKVGEYSLERMVDALNGVEVVEGYSLQESRDIRNKLIRYYNMSEKG